MATVKPQEPIFELAVECETLFANQISRLNDDGDQNASRIVLDLYQRFETWAAFLGVFAESNICLDRRLGHHIEIQDQVLRLLDIMQRNLTNLFNHGDSPGQGDGALSERESPLLQQVRISLQSLDAVSGALDRLNHLGIAIRRSTVTSQISKARELAETFDLASFERVAYISLKTLYVDASESLIEQLAQSMRDTYALFLHRKSRKERLEVARVRLRAQPRLHPIAEESLQSENILSPLDIDIEGLRGSQGLSINVQTHLPPPPAIMIPRSEPTSVDTQGVKARLKRMLSPSIKSKLRSILVNQANYPRPARGSLMCDWCFSPLATDELEESKWQHHLNDDFKPYICISENCSASMPRFGSSTEWFQHMITTHGEGWHRDVHSPSSWICPLCIEMEATFPSPDQLSAHLENSHEGIFTEQQANAVVRQSRFPFPRPQDTCPVCCLPVGKEQRPDPKERDKKYGQSKGKSYIERPDVSGPKRLKRDSNDPGLDYEREERVSPKAIATHVAAHLQNLMLFTLRLISIDAPEEESVGIQSAPDDTAYQASWVSSGPRDLDEAVYDEEEEFPGQDDGEMDTEYSLHSQEAVPDSEYMDWNHVPRIDEDLTHRSGPSLTLREIDEDIQSRLQARGNAIKRLVNSERVFARQIQAADRLYRGRASECKDLSPEDISTIFPDPVPLINLSATFEQDLARAAGPFYTSLPQELPPSGETTQERTLRLKSELEIDNSTLIGKAFEYHMLYMSRVYMEYLKRHTAAERKLCLVEKRSRVATWLKRYRGLASPPLDDLHMVLAMPLTHFMDYHEMLKELLRFTPSDHPDRTSLVTAFKEVKNINVSIKRAMERRELIDRLSNERPAEPSWWLGLPGSRNRDSNKQEGGADPEYDTLAQEFDENFTQLQIVNADMEMYMQGIVESVDRFKELVGAIERFEDQPPTINSIDYRVGLKWRALDNTVLHIQGQLPEHLDAVRRQIIDPICTLLDLYDGPRKLMLCRDWMDDSGLLIDESGMERRPDPKALDRALKAELPVLYSQTKKLVERCLQTFVSIQAGWFKFMHMELSQRVDSLPDSVQGIVDDFESKYKIPEAQVLALAVCNGSVLNESVNRPRGRPALVPSSPSRLSD